jgi:hypothetical protein
VTETYEFGTSCGAEKVWNQPILPVRQIEGDIDYPAVVGQAASPVRRRLSPAQGFDLFNCLLQKQMKAGAGLREKDG